jgi:hypothetical protein
MVTGSKRTTRVEPVGSTVDVTDLPQEREVRFSFDQEGVIPPCCTQPTTSSRVYYGKGVIPPSADEDVYSYDPDGGPSRCGSVTTTVYDAEGRVCLTQDGDVTTYTYDVAKGARSSASTVWTSSGSITTYTSGGVQYEITIEFRYGFTTFPA